LVRIEQLKDIDPDAAHQLSRGYLVEQWYRASKTESHEETVIRLTLETAEKPVAFDWPMTDWDRRTWRSCVANELGLGAWDGEQMVGFCLGERQHWNRTLWVYELHVAAPYRGQGIGGRMVERAAEWGQANGMRTMLVEVQSDNVRAISFYHKQGFSIEAVDLSYYSNQDMEPGRRVALFMKRRLISDA